MTPAVVASQAVRNVRTPNRAWDRMFFSAMALLVLASVLYGFARTYFLAGMVAAPLPNRLIHVHGAAFTLWIVLLIVQTALISARRVRVHMTLGMGGFGLAVAMVGLGVFAAADALRWRASILDIAKERAAQLDLDGAAYPWRTIRGEECSAYWPAATAAWHINADIAMAFERYRAVTGDNSLEEDCGLELLVDVTGQEEVLFGGSFKANLDVGDEAGSGDRTSEVSVVGIGCAYAANTEADVASGGNGKNCGRRG